MALATRSSVELIDPSLLPIIVRGVVIEQYFQVTILGVLVYDMLITLDKEAKYFWKLPRRPVDFVYFVNRYLGILGAISRLCWDSFSATLTLCNFAEWTGNISNWITIISIDYILMIRVLALYSQDRTMDLFLKTFLVLEAASKLGFIIYLTILEHDVVGGFATMTFCGFSNIPPWQLGMVSWIIPLVYGVILMTLALYKAAEYWRISSRFKGFTLVKVLIWDQVMYYTLVIACSVFAILQFKLKLSNLLLSNVMGSLGNHSFLCVLGSRMLFNLKEAGERGQNEGTSYRSSSQTMSDMDFAEPPNPQRESGTESGICAEYA